jgi:hypothetical protein
MIMHREVCWGNLLQNSQSEDREVIGEYNITLDLTDTGFMNTNSMEQLYGVKSYAFDLGELASPSIRK